MTLSEPSRFHFGERSMLSPWIPFFITTNNIAKHKSFPGEIMVTNNWWLSNLKLQSRVNSILEVRGNFCGKLWYELKTYWSVDTSDEKEKLGPVWSEWMPMSRTARVSSGIEEFSWEKCFCFLRKKFLRLINYCFEAWHVGIEKSIVHEPQKKKMVLRQWSTWWYFWIVDFRFLNKVRPIQAILYSNERIAWHILPFHVFIFGYHWELGLGHWKRRIKNPATYASHLKARRDEFWFNRFWVGDETIFYLLES